jgi:tellurium resistance protein TerD
VGVSLSKGESVSLVKSGGGGLSQVRMGLGWDAVKKRGLFGSRSQSIDLDASALLFDGTNQLVDQVWFQQLTSRDGSVQHTGDNLTGEGEGDDEMIKVNLAAVPAECAKIVFPVSIYDAETRGQSFGQVRNAFIRIVNQAGGGEIARYDLSEDASTETAMVFGEVYRNAGEWKFRAVGQGYTNGLAGIARDFGVNVG